MKIKKKEEMLVIDGGLLMPIYETEVSKVKSWEFVVEDDGANYFSFKYHECTQICYAGEQDVSGNRRNSGVLAMLDEIKSAIYFLLAAVTLGVLAGWVRSAVAINNQFEKKSRKAKPPIRYFVRREGVLRKSNFEYARIAS